MAQLSAYGDNMDENKVEEIIEETPVSDTEAEKKVGKKDEKVTKKDILISLGIVLGVLAVTISVILGCVFGIAGNKADAQIGVNEEKGAEYSKTYLLTWLNRLTDDTNNNLDLPNGTFVYSIDEIELEDTDRKLKVERPIEESHYEYVFKFEVRDTEYEVTMDARNGRILSVEIDN